MRRSFTSRRGAGVAVFAAAFLGFFARSVGAAPVSPPTSLTATALSSSQIRLTWTDPNNNEEAYFVERSLSSTSGFTQIASAAANATTYTSTGLAAGTTYYYRVRGSFKNGSYSGYSNVASARTTSVAGVPVAPSNLAATAISSSQINLGWTDNSSNETGFRVERSLAAAGPWTFIGTTALTGYGDSALAAGTPYYYRIQSYNSSGNSAYSNTATATTQGGTGVPAVPGSLTATSASASQINLVWVDTSGNETGFKIERSTSTSPWAQIATVGANVASYASTGLAASTTYSYRVRANNTAGDSGYSNTASAATAGTGGAGAFIWSKDFGGTSAFDSVAVWGMAVDDLGEVAITGTIANIVNLGSGTLTSAGSTDIFVAKYASNGTPLWSKRIGSTMGDVGKAVAVDGNGSVYVTGYFRGTVDFGGGPVSTSLTSAFLAKYSSTGLHQWSKKMSTATSGTDEGTALAADVNGNVVVGGSVYQTSDFGGGPLTSAGAQDVFLVKYSSSGVHTWSRRMGGTADDVVNKVALDGSGNVALTGYFSGSADFGGGTLANAGGKDIFVAKYSSAGAHVWSKRFGGSLEDIARSVAVDGSGNVVLTGNFASSSVDFGGGALLNSGGADIFLAKYSSAGAHVWSKRFGGSFQANEIGNDVATDGAGNVLLTGSVVDTITFGGASLPSDGYYDIFLAKFSATGAHVWSKRTGAGEGKGIGTDASNNVITAGIFSGSTPVNFGGTDLLSPGGNDLFLVKLGP
jgi:fibronectin type III domain protein/beta-propeller repeat-containing protein